MSWRRELSLPNVLRWSVFISSTTAKDTTSILCNWSAASKNKKSSLRVQWQHKGKHRNVLLEHYSLHCPPDRNKQSKTAVRNLKKSNLWFIVCCCERVWFRESVKFSGETLWTLFTTHTHRIRRDQSDLKAEHNILNICTHDFWVMKFLHFVCTAVFSLDPLRKRHILLILVLMSSSEVKTTRWI